jgi:cyanate lyase
MNYTQRLGPCPTVEVGERLGLDADAVRLLQTIPVRGSIPGGVPTDPTIYCFYEMVQIHGSTIKKVQDQTVA